MKSIKLKLLVFVGIIVLICSAILFQRSYSSVTANIEKLTKQQLNLALDFDLAIRDYAAETIRPLMFRLVSKGTFIPETMSTSYIARRVFEKVREKYPDYIIKFASDNPRNPVNQAGPEELKMIRFFNDNPLNKSWTGGVDINGGKYLATFSAMRMEKPCLRCHGDPADAPYELIKMYGSDTSFHRQLGKVVGLDIVAIPSDNVNKILLNEKFKNLGFLGMVILLLSASLIFVFKFTITDRLSKIANHFSDVVTQSDDLEIRSIEMAGNDEITGLAINFNKLAEKLNNMYNELRSEINRRKQIQEALSQSEEKFRLLTEGTSEAIVWHDKGEVIEANKRYYELFGYEPEELAGKDAISLTVTPDSIKFMRQLISLDHPGPYRVEGMRKDGSMFPMEIRAKIIKYNGKMARMGAIRDLTRQMQAEEALIKSEKRYRAVVESQRELICRFLPDGTLTFVNKAYCRYFGKRREELVGQNLVLLIPEKERNIVLKRIFSLNQKNSVMTHEHQVLNPKGEICWQRWTNQAIFDDQQKLVEIQSTGWDITERIRAEKALMESEKRYRTIFEQAADSILIIDPKTGSVVDFNMAAYKNLGYTLQEFKKLKVSDFDIVNSDKQLKELMTKIIKTGGDFFETKHRKKDGRTINILANCRGISFFGEDFVQCICRDFTDIKYSEELIKSSLKEKELLLREIHHRVKNNFEIISSLLDMSSMAIDNQTVKDLLLSSKTRIHSMAMIHSQLYQSDQFDRIDMARHIGELAENLQCLYGSEKNVDLVIEPSEVYLSLSQAIPSALMLNELITNSLKHAFVEKEHGKIQISIHNSDDNTVLLRVRDDGGGIPEEIDVKPAGGLGLKLVKHIAVGQLKGDMRCINNDGTDICIEFKRLG